VQGIWKSRITANRFNLTFLRRTIMCKKNVLTIVAVAILALAIGQVQAVTVR